MNKSDRSWVWRRRFLVRLYPELDLFDSDGEAKTAFRECGSVWLIALTAFVSTALAAIVGNYCESHFGSWGFFPTYFVALFSFASLGISVQKRAVHRKLRSELVTRGVPICIPCGYDLRGLAEPRCPECGSSFDSALLGKIEKNAASGGEES